MHKIKRLLYVTVCILLTLIICWGYSSLTAYSATDRQGKNILFISSYNENFPSVPDQIKGIRSIFPEEEYSIDFEYMDSKRFVTEQSRKLFHDLLQYKIEDLPAYDGIIVGDDYALQFVMDYQQELFSGIPITFFGVNDMNRVKEAEERTNITGIVEELSIKDNISLGLKLNKKAKKVVAIVDNTLTGIGDENQFISLKDEFPELAFEEINVAEHTFAEVGEQVGKLGQDTILLYLSMYTDKTGANMTIPEASAILSKAASIPIIRAEVGGVGNGILGGKMHSYYHSGEKAANLLKKVFEGTPVDSLPVIYKSPNYYVFDYKVLKKFNIPLHSLPKDSTIIGKNATFIEQHPVLTANIIVIASLFTLVIILLSTDNIRRRKMDKLLQESHEELVQTYEELTASEEELRGQYDLSQRHMENIEILNQKYSIAVESTGSAVWEYDVTLRTLSISEEFINSINPQLAQIKNIDIFLEKFLCEEDRDNILSQYERYIKGETDKIYMELMLYNSENKKRWVMISGRGIHDLKGTVMSLNGLLIDITKIKEQEEYINYLARNDYMTNLPNRVSFMDKIKSELELKSCGAILLLDIDNFKVINDTMGHLYGDRMLSAIAERINTIVTDNVWAYRFGGDEFLILITGAENEQLAEGYLLKLKELFAKPIRLMGKEHFVKFSIGVTVFPKDSSDMERLLINADTAMYYVKDNGKGSHMFYSDKIMEDIRSRAEIEDILRDALREDGLRLVYQPQINVVTGKIDEFEALLRLKDRNLSPAKFIEVAEMSGLIIEIGRWVTKEAIRQMAKWRDEGYPLKPVAINFSGKQLSDREYISFLSSTLEEYQIDSRYVEIEITESILVEETENTLAFLNELKSLGIRIAMDDFGTGYSSLNYLTFIPVDKIKLDKSLCEKFINLDNSSVMSSLIGLMHSLDLIITAEGIEETYQYHRLKEGGCDLIQGYLFSKPLASQEIEKIYNHNFIG
ncbi:EAL domain-containing protein [Anaerocolumna xylanovorans]|uniref:PAS domain S-box-containing protein/diguanylate cyclase (GGDEF) domain-containing protein n=1 Tax=Anaerocolumna xylanovorans DSM 12503 TaxID=1121345 RepID=A0A1M7YET1_9FIRM|nr:EAL domain-containing protein [Anaerocolumna xylanovorans]SHO51152.1 PAS domain S-box-containing protein/diguanylate cyclase (GGDEF) domain-containing protein [Anaerocolumna xylanovorans DSM 12503]